MAPSQSIAVIGLGKLGCPMAAVFADKGFPTIGVDLNPSVVAAINEGQAPIQEPHLQQTMDRARARLSATTAFSDAIAKSDVSFVIVPTPSTVEHTFSNAYLESAIESIGEALRTNPRPHVVVVSSTVMPGSTQFLVERLEKASGRKIGEGLGVCYSPEFIALGSVIENLRRPDIVLIGESDQEAGDRIVAIYAKVHDNNPEVHRMNFVNAEVCKLALNAYVTTKITYANMIADLCEKLPGGDCDVVTNALGGDSRIGRKYLRGAVGYGGPCFPRDNKALVALARSVGANSALSEATDGLNDYQVARFLALVKAHVPTGRTVAVLGAAYKPDTNVIEASQGIMIARALFAQGYHVTIADPQAAEAAATVVDSGIACHASTTAALVNADAAFIATPWPEFAESFSTASDKPLVIFDPWRMVNPEKVHSGFTVIVPGRYRAPGLI